MEAAKIGGDAVWVGSDALSVEEHYRFASEGVKVTRFTYPLIGVEDAVVEDALASVEEHHPGEIIWVQHAKKPWGAESYSSEIRDYEQQLERRFALSPPDQA